MKVGFKRGLVSFFLLASSSIVNAAIITSQGAGSAVSNVTNQATFDELVFGQSLLNYQEGGLNVSVADTYGRFGFEGIYYSNGGNRSFVEITSQEGFLFSGLEMDVFSGTGARLSNLVWQTLRDGVETGAGLFRDIEVGFGNFGIPATLGWSDEDFFDTLRVGLGRGSLFGSTEYTQFGDYNLIGIDNLQAELVSGSSTPVTSVPEPSAFALSLLGLVLLGKRRYVSKILKIS
jgi:hypothetical protein